MDMGLEIFFVHSDPTVAYMENIRLKNNNLGKDEFNPFVFD